jgi:hypothetical protein
LRMRLTLNNTTRWAISEPSRRESESVNGVEEHHSLVDFGAIAA